MTTAQQIVDHIEASVPLRWQERWDNSGWQVGDRRLEVTGILLCVDVTEEVMDEAQERGCNMIIAHHPLIFTPLKRLMGESRVERCVMRAVRDQVAIYSIHTNLDSSPVGINYWLAQALGLINLEVLDPHPSEKGVGIGVVGDLPEAIPLEALLAIIADKFRDTSIGYSVPTHAAVQRIAICGGSGGSLISQAIAAGAEVLFTGEAKYSDYIDVQGALTLVTAGHFTTEECMKELIFRVIKEKSSIFVPILLSSTRNPITYI